MKRLCGQPSRGKLGFVALILLLSVAVPGARGSAPVASPPGQVLAQDQLDTLERKLLQRTFPLDTEDKRLQRLECLVFGGTQMGTLQDRLAELKQAVAQSSKSQATHPTSKSIASSVAEIEQQVLKKTNPSLPIPTRLSQLETKVFGQISPNMTLPQRVERLRKTIGLTDPFNSAQTAIQPFESTPNKGFSFRYYGDPNGLDGRQLPPQMSQMLREMDRQMRQFDGMLERGGQGFDLPDLPNGFRYDFSLPRTEGDNPFIEIIPGNPGKPGAPGIGNGKPGQSGKPGAPGVIIRKAPTRDIPPYGAPDTI
jgi:hypothetical protein